MATTIHFIDVGQGNMVLIQAADGKIFVFDCNLTDENENRVLNYVEKQIGRWSSIYAFICSHRDSDHIRGIKKLHRGFAISRIWDSDYPGTTTDCDEYREYMDLRRQLPVTVVKKLTRDTLGARVFAT
jgi:beta-lactamase superfamily II metal-dependent hydrolase